MNANQSQTGVFAAIIGRSMAMRKVFKQIKDISPTSTTVLIEGETGTGKELVAQTIHQLSPRRNQPFMAIHCSAITETLMESELFGHEKGAFTGAVKPRLGRFEYADGGTIFLDEVSEIPLNIQIKLLRVLQEKEIQRIGGNRSIPVDVRIIAATNKKLREAVSKKIFREDLFYRLNVFPVHLPPLRARGNDIPLIANHFLIKHAQKLQKPVHRFSPEIIKIIQKYPWPGNVRELENVIERSVIEAKGDTINTVILQSDETTQWMPIIEQQVLNIPYKQAKEELLDKFEKEYITKYLKKYNGNVAAAAQHSGISLRSFYRKMQQHKIAKYGNIANSGNEFSGEDHFFTPER
jgi:two-component system response regulator HydG